MLNNKSFKILSIDGGGIKGLYSAIVLTELQKKYGDIYKYFDLVTGTSTGGIIALAVASGKDMEEIANMYKNDGRSIFPKGNIYENFKRTIYNWFIGAKYKTEPLEDKLNNIFGNQKVKDLNTRICVPAIICNDTSIQPTIFKTCHHSSLNGRDDDRLIVDIALATSAAPTFFKKAVVKNLGNYLVDGGLWMNNPAIAGIIEAMSYFVGVDKEYADIKLLSIGNIQTKLDICKRDDITKGWGCGKKVIDLMFLSQSRSTEELINLFKKNKIFPISNYMRIEKIIDDKSKSNIDMDNTDSEVLENIEKYALNDIRLFIEKKNICDFFSEKIKNWKQNIKEK